MSDHLWMVWLGLALVLGVAELTTVNLVFVMLAGGALAGAATAATGAGLGLQAIVAAVVAALLLGVVRPSVMRRLNRGASHVALGAKALVGRACTVVEQVTVVGGLVHLTGEDWSARSGDNRHHNVGEIVTVSAIEGATAVVVTARDEDGRVAPHTPQDF